MHPHMANPDQAHAAFHLRGTRVTLDQLSPVHGIDLFHAIGGSSNTSLWQYIGHKSCNIDDEEEFCDMIQELSMPRANAAEWFAIIDHNTTRAVGIGFLDPVDDGKNIVGHGFLMIAPQYQKTPLGTEVIYLLGYHIFEVCIEYYLVSRETSTWTCTPPRTIPHVFHTYGKLVDIHARQIPEANNFS